GEEKVHLLGIDAPEKANSSLYIGDQEPYASRSEIHLRTLILSEPHVEIRRAKKKDTYGRTLAYVFAGGKNVNAEMVRSGNAWEAVSQYGSQGMTAEAEAVRRAWSEVERPKFESPFEWRRTNKR
ncbi:MAG: thermonuclease family protein, partial [Planctomycetes bacterium]|nr:thermonuclease family protein [Planctomycetota bacterium]